MIETLQKIAVILLPVFVGSLLLCVNNRKLKDREMHKTACLRFLEAINSAVGGLIGNSDGFFTLDETDRVKASVVPVNLACHNFSPFLTKSKRLALDQSMQAYCKACQEGIPKWNAAKEAVHAAISDIELVLPAKIFKTHVDKLLSFVDKT